MNDAEMIEQRRTAFVNAFNRADVDAIVEFLTEDLVSMPPNQPPLVGKEASRAWFKEGFRVAPSGLTESIQALQVLGDWAVERVTWTLESQSTGGGVPAKDNGKGLHIWRRKGETWKVAQAIWNSDNAMSGFVAASNELDSVGSLYDQLAAAAVAGDADKYSLLFADDAVLMPPNVAVVTGRSGIREWARAFFRTWRVEIDALTFDQQEAGDRVAFCRYRATGTNIPAAGGEPVVFDHKYLDALVKQVSGTWRFAAHMWSSNVKGGIWA